MSKRFLTGLLLAAVCVASLYSCKKLNKSTEDYTRNYFPLTFGRYITYAVDSIKYTKVPLGLGGAFTGVRTEIKSQMKYAVTDTFTDKKKKLNYIMNIYERPYDGAIWQQTGVILLQPTADGLLYTQDQNTYIKMMFPVKDGLAWLGNKFVETGDPEKAYFKDWTYKYRDYHRNYFNGYINFDNTVTCIEQDESSSYLDVDSSTASYRTFAKEVYAYNVGMIYKEWTHWTHDADTTQIKNGYTVIMQAIDHN